MLLREYLAALKYGAKILPSEILGSPFGASEGNVYWAKKSTDSNYTSFYADHYVKYTDGTASVYNTIQGAVDAATAARGDIVIVCSGKWCEDVVVADKEGLRILGVGYGSGGTEDGAPRMRPSDATTKYPFDTKIGSSPQAAGFHIFSRNVEISGFYFDGGGNYCGVYAGGGLNGGVTGYTTENCSGLWVHNNFFRGGSEGSVGLYMNGVRFGAIIEGNIFERWTGAAIEMDAGNASNEACIIRNNQFIADNGGYGVNIYGEANSSLGCQIDHNVFGDRVSHAFTMAIMNNTGSTGCTVIAGNNFACAHCLDLTTADWVSGNSFGFAGSATEGSNLFITEAASGAEA